MPSDIRSFFGGKPPPPPAEPEAKPKKTATKKGRGSRKVIEDDSEEEAQAPAKTKKSTPVKRAVKREPSPDGEATTTSDYFGKKKPQRSAEVVTAPVQKKEPTTPVKKTNSKSNGTSVNGSHPEVKTTPASTRSTRAKVKTEPEQAYDEYDFPDDLEEDDSEDMAKPKSAIKANGSAKSTPAKKTTPAKSTTSTRSSRRQIKDDVDYAEEEDVDMRDVDDEDDFDVPDEDEKVTKSKPAAKAKAAAGSKRKAKDLVDDDEEEDGPKKRGRKSSGSGATKKKKDEVEDSAEIQAIMASIPTVRAPTPPPKDESGGPPKFFAYGQHKNSEAPAGEGSKEIPEGAENCLAGMSFVFTGQLETLGREKGQELVKRYGGKVTGAPSGKTSFVVLGDDAGPSKLRKIRDLGIKTVNEDGLFELIRRLPANGGDSKAAAQFAEKKAKEEKALQESVKEMVKEEKVAAAAAKANPGKANADAQGPDSRLWTVKYAPTQLGQICGNKTVVEKLQRWLRDFHKNLAIDFKKPGPDGSGTFRAVIMHGPPGIGKTTAAHLVAKLEGYDIVESNASDTRSKKMVENGLLGVLDTTSINGYFAGDGKDVASSKRKLCLIMDEVDGMSAGDRGGVGAMASVCKKARIPIILICNERRLPKMKPFDYVAYDLPFRRPTVDQIRGRIATIAFREGMKLPPTVLNALIEGTGADIRQVVNMISTAKLDEGNMDFNDGKAMSKAWEKHVILKPWDLTSKIIGGGMFNKASKHTLNEKIELYFNDHEFSYLMLQENYLGTNPILSLDQPDEKRNNLKKLQLVDKAADSISDGDLVDRMIHGSQQQWSLMPAHAVFSFVRPASFIAGSQAYGRTSFTSWLGNNSAQGKFTRLIKEIQGHMRLRTTGDRHEIRQQYLPVLWQELINRMQTEGKEAIDEVIALMDSYYLTKDDYDAIQELGVGPHNQEKVNIASADKAAFTREYNKRDHPLPFIKASAIAQPKKVARDKPDLEEAIEESEDEEVVEVKDEEDVEMDLSKDKYVQKPKKKKAPAKSKGKAKNEDRDEDDQPKKGKAKATTAKGKGKAKK